MPRMIIDPINVVEAIPLILNFEFTEDSFFEFCQLNKDLRIERDENGIIHLRSPTGFDTGQYNADIITDLNIWNRQAKAGVAGESNTGYTLPNGAVRSPDTS